jgi:hypothetical protein
VARVRPRSTRYKPEPYRERNLRPLRPSSEWPDCLHLAGAAGAQNARRRLTSLGSRRERSPAACQQRVSNSRQNEDNRVQPAELQSGSLPPDVHPGRNKSAALAGSTSWGSLVRAQHRPPERARGTGLFLSPDPSSGPCGPSMSATCQRTASSQLRIRTFQSLLGGRRGSLPCRTRRRRYWASH